MSDSDPEVFPYEPLGDALEGRVRSVFTDALHETARRLAVPADVVGLATVGHAPATDARHGWIRFEATDGMRWHVEWDGDEGEALDLARELGQTLAEMLADE